jgi:hypothetical protein
MHFFNVDGSPEMLEEHTPGFRRLMYDLGISSYADIQRRREKALEALPELWKVTEGIMAANPNIEEEI